MTTTLHKVANFHNAFGQNDPAEPTMPLYAEGDTVSVELNMVATHLENLAEDLMTGAERHEGNLLLLRLQLCVEEVGELARAMHQGDLVEALDALCDMRYVADGTVLALGLRHVFSDAFDEVHRSNMSKLDEHGEPIISPAGRVVKSDQFSRPDLGQFLDK